MPVSWEEKSRTRKKKESHAAQEIGERLTALSDEDLQRIGLPEDLLEAVRFAKTIKKRGALRRQLQYIGTLMRHHDPVRIENAVKQMARRGGVDKRRHRKIEDWRDRLINGDAGLAEWLCRRVPDKENLQRFEILIRNAQKEKTAGGSPKAGRLLFRYLRSLADQLPMD